MTDITKLPDKWRCPLPRSDGTVHTHKIKQDCAYELEVALPKWTKITDDPDTWPEEEQDILYVVIDAIFGGFHRPRISTFRVQHSTRFLMKYWRPLCDLDRPS